jgi:hypothetical protein
MDEDVRITLRLPKDLHEQLVALARGELRSLNNLLVYALRQYASEQATEQASGRSEQVQARANKAR